MQEKWGVGGYHFGPSVGYRVEQGAILSPIVFNLHVYELSKAFRAYKTKCIVGNIMYADDLMVFSPSSLLILHTCSAYGVENSIEIQRNRHNARTLHNDL